jgi:hypothetical protein
MRFYETVVEEQLSVSREFLEEYADAIREQLQLAAVEFSRVHGNIFAINMCLHVASSVILNNSGNLQQTLDLLRSKTGLEGKDPSTVLTVLMLYYLVKWDTTRAASEKKNATTQAEKQRVGDYEAKLQMLSQGFEEIKWVIGEEAMRILEFEDTDAWIQAGRR